MMNNFFCQLYPAKSGVSFFVELTPPPFVSYMTKNLSVGSYHYEMDSDVHVALKANRAQMIAENRPDLSASASIARTASQTQEGIEHACRTVNQIPEACPKAIAGISQACQDCVRRFLSDRSSAA